MAEVLTETSNFDANVVVPQAGDARTAASVKSPIQKLTNRTKWAKDYLDELNGRADGVDAILNTLRTIASYEVGTGSTSGRANLTEVFDRSPVGDFTVSSNRVTVPNTGTYQIHVSIVVKNTDNDNPQAVGYIVYADSTLLFQTFQSVPSENDGGLATISCSMILNVTTPGSQRINIVYGSSSAGVSALDSGVAGILTVQQVVPDL